MILMHIYLAVKMAILLLHIFANMSESPIVFRPFFKAFFFYAHTGFMENIVFGFVVSIFVWVLVLFRGKNYFQHEEA